MCRGGIMDTLDKGYWICSCQAGGKVFMDVVDIVKEDIQEVGVTEEESSSRWDEHTWSAMVTP